MTLTKLKEDWEGLVIVDLKIKYPLKRVPATKQAAPTKACSHTEQMLLEVFKEHIEHRQIILNRVIDPTAVEMVIMQIEKFNFEDDEEEATQVGFDRTQVPITLYINSPGGYLHDGLAIVSAIEQSRTPVITVAQGAAMSAAFLVLVSGHARFAYRHCRLMYHQASSGSIGMLQEMREDLEESTDLQGRVDEIILRRTHLTANHLAEINNRKRNWYLWPEDAVEFGIIDGIPSVGLPVQKQPIEHYTKLAETIHLAKKAETEVKKVKKVRGKKNAN